MREVYDRIGGAFTIFAAACVVFIIVFAFVWLAWGPPSKAERISDLEKRVARLETERP